MRFSGLIFFILYILSAGICAGQHSYDLVLQAGKVIKNYPGFPDTDAGYAGRFYWSKRLNGNKPWHQYYYYPEVSVQAIYGCLGNKEKLGSIAGVNGGFRFVKELNHRLTISAEAGFGAAYFNRPFNEFSNNENVAIGSKITALGTADAGIFYAFHPNWSLIGKLSVLHCSNAHIALPNAGINMPLITAGIRYRPVAASLINRSPEQAETDKRPRLNFRIAIGKGEKGGTSGPVNGPAYSVFLASLYINRHYTPVARWQMGIEGYYNDGTYAYITSQSFYEDSERLKSSSVLYMLGHEYIFGNVGFVTQGGLYIYNPFARDLYKLTDGNPKDFLKTWIAARLGFHYYLFNPFLRKSKNVFAGWYVKTNLGKADFMEMTIGYAF